MARSGAKIIGIVALGVWLPLALISLLPVLMSVMIFDAPGSTTAPLTIALGLSIVSFPLLAVAGAAGAALVGFAAKRAETDEAYRRERNKALLLALLPLASVAAVAICVGLIQLFCGGSLVCR